MPYGWKGNRRSGVALAMRNRLTWFIYLRAHGLDREMSTPPTLSCGVWPIYLTFTTAPAHLVKDALKRTGDGRELRVWIRRAPTLVYNVKVGPKPTAQARETDWKVRLARASSYATGILQCRLNISTFQEHLERLLSHLTWLNQINQGKGKVHSMPAVK